MAAIVRYTLLIHCAALIHTCLSGGHCQRQIFYELQNKWSDERVLIKRGPWPLYKCLRYVVFMRFSIAFVVGFVRDVVAVVDVVVDASATVLVVSSNI